MRYPRTLLFFFTVFFYLFKLHKSQPHLCLTVVLFGTLATAVTFLSATLPGSVLQVSTVTQNSSPTHPFLISVV